MLCFTAKLNTEQIELLPTRSYVDYVAFSVLDIVIVKSNYQFTFPVEFKVSKNLQLLLYIQLRTF